MKKYKHLPSVPELTFRHTSFPLLEEIWQPRSEKKSAEILYTQQFKNEKNVTINMGNKNTDSLAAAIPIYSPRNHSEKGMELIGATWGKWDQ